MLSSHSIVSSFRTVRPCSPWGSRWVGHWRTIWSTVCSSAPRSQASEKAFPLLYQQERKCPTPVPSRLSRTQALLGRVALGHRCRCWRWKCGVLSGHLHSMDGWALRGADVQVPRHGVLETMLPHYDEAQQVGCLRERRTADVVTGPSLYDIATNVNQTCHYESNHCYPRWMCSPWAG